MSFAQAINTPMKTTTTNGMAAFDKTGSKVLDLFSSVGSSRNNENIVQTFMLAFGDSPELALKCLFWARDARGGAGERQTFRTLIQSLEKVNPSAVLRNIHHIPTYGRWDDMFVFQTPCVKQAAFEIYKKALMVEQNGLAAKWCPRQGPIANEFRKFLNMTPKSYRKLIVGLSKTVEQQLCAQQWSEVNYEHVPSVASTRYQQTFKRHDGQRYDEYITKVNKGEAKMNASVLFPHDVYRSYKAGTDPEVIEANWNSLPNYVGDAKILPVSDVSGSMDTRASGSITCMDVSISLGMYLASKNTGAFKDVICTFSTEPKLVTVSGSIVEKFKQVERLDWGGSTNITATFDRILEVSVNNKVPKEDMPELIVILSDMQFCANGCWYDNGKCYNQTAVEMINTKYAQAGYKVPGLVFWNLNSNYANTPATKNDVGVVEVSGFSPNIMKAVITADFEKITPEIMMLDVLLSDRYKEIH